MSKHEFKIGGVWEGEGFDIEQNYEVIDNSYKPCKHAHSKHEVESRRINGEKYYTTAYIIPFVAIQINEGGYCTTGTCAECIVEALTNLKVTL